jgi:hypothetical protein
MRREYQRKNFISWDIISCSQLKVNLRFGRIGSLHLQDRRINQVRNQLSLPPDITLVSCLAYFLSWRWSRHVHPVDFQWTTQRYSRIDRTLHNHRCQNLKSCNIRQENRARSEVLKIETHHTCVLMRLVLRRIKMLVKFKQWKWNFKKCQCAY